MWCNLLQISLLVLVGSNGFIIKEEENLENAFKKGLQNYMETGLISNEFNKSIGHLHQLNLYRFEDKYDVSDIGCALCNIASEVVISSRKSGTTVETMIDIVENLCLWLNIATEPICHGAVSAYAPAIAYMIDKKQDLTGGRVCSIILQSMGCTDQENNDWAVDIPQYTNPTHTEKVYSESKPLKILHLTDIHYDSNYEAGSNSKCDHFLCCQKGTKPTNPEDAAGYWGEVGKCDLPWHVITQSLEHITTQHKDVDLIYFTGDINSHNVWESGVVKNSKDIKDFYGLLRNTFETTPIYPILGNHEPHPMNMYSSEGVNDSDLTTQWLYDLAAEEWKSWLPKETTESILRGGFYTTLVKPGFRVIGLNSNFCYTNNWWLFFSDKDPFHQLQWLVDVLVEAEKNNEFVHILSHIPNGLSDCSRNWSREFSKIITRFSHIIAAQFNGHTHYDRTVVFFNVSDPSQAINVAYDGGSLTTYSKTNPNYKIFEINSNNGEVLDFETWTYDVDEANLTPEKSPNWYKLYSFKQAYDLKNLTAPAIAQLAEKMAKTPRLTELYFRYKYRDAEPKIALGCDKDCEIENLCEMVTSHFDDTFHCEMLKDIYNSARP